MGTIAITVGVGSTPLPGPATAPPFARDTFTDTAGVLLQNHTPELGGPWVAHPSNTAAPVISNANRVRNNNNNNGPWLMTAAPSGADVIVSADIQVLTTATGVDVELVARADPTATTYYFAGYASGAPGSFRLARFVAGGFTSLGANASGFSVGAHTLELRAVGSLISVYADGSLVIQVTDTGIAGAGRVGFRFAGLAGDAERVHADNFSAVNA